MKIGQKTLWRQWERVWEHYGAEHFSAICEDVERAVQAKGRRRRER